VHLPAESVEEPCAAGRLVVADRATEERDHAGATARDHVEMAVEVADDTVHGEPGVVAGDHLGCTDQRAFADVERHVALERAARAQRVEQHACLVGAARAELDQRVGVREIGDRSCLLGQDRSFGFGGVVLGQPRDLVEQLASLRVVEPLRGRSFGLADNPLRTSSANAR
jgi:hypothetical protein